MGQQKRLADYKNLDKQTVAIEIDKFLRKHAQDIRSYINLTIERKDDGFDIKSLEEFEIEESSVMPEAQIDGAFTFAADGKMAYIDPASKISMVKSVRFGGVVSL
ncbi:MAG: hypothetical protein J6J53_01250, partial [Muribaculaceae bacterium]|nr:hypothetical protein [Muribaculaceae bacterium]